MIASQHLKVLKVKRVGHAVYVIDRCDDIGLQSFKRFSTLSKHWLLSTHARWLNRNSFLLCSSYRIINRNSFLLCSSYRIISGWTESMFYYSYSFYIYFFGLQILNAVLWYEDTLSTVYFLSIKTGWSPASFIWAYTVIQYCLILFEYLFQAKSKSN